MAKEKYQKDLFDFLNKNGIRYAVLRGYDEESEKIGKDLDILILKEDYEKFKNKFPKTNRVLDFYINKEKHKGITFIPKKALYRTVFDAKKGFYKLCYKDYKRMRFFRKILNRVRKIKRFLGMYKKNGKN